MKKLILTIALMAGIAGCSEELEPVEKDLNIVECSAGESPMKLPYNTELGRPDSEMDVVCLICKQMNCPNVEWNRERWRQVMANYEQK